MNLTQRERNASSRVLAAAEVLAAQRNLAVPDALRSISGSPLERHVGLMEAIATMLEILAMESIKPGLGELVSERQFTIADLRNASDEELLAIPGVGEATVNMIRSAPAPPFVLVPALGDEEPDEDLGDVPDDDDG
jgi:DNA uptake protein ComE-like DNA-binding protein